MSRIARPLFLLLAAFLAVTLARADEPPELAALRSKAERGNGLAMYNLGLAYTEGDGVQQNLAEAFVWLSLARENGATGKALDAVLGNISDRDLNRGRRMLTEYRNAVNARVAAIAAQAAQRRPTGRTFTVATPGAPTEVIHENAPAVTTAPVTTPPAATTSYEPMVPGTSTVTAPAVDETANLRAELARANATIEEQAATIAKLREDIRRLLPVTTVGASAPARTSSGDGAGSR